MKLKLMRITTNVKKSKPKILPIICSENKPTRNLKQKELRHKLREAKTCSSAHVDKVYPPGE